MRFKGKKIYGEYKIVGCPFCDKQATSKNEQGIEVCSKHVKKSVEEIKCVCGSWLEPKGGKFGRYFNCLECGNINYDKAMEIKQITMKDIKKVEIIAKDEVYNKPTKSIRKKKEITITSNDSFYFD
jgi:hypothetical protein